MTLCVTPKEEQQFRKKYILNFDCLCEAREIKGKLELYNKKFFCCFVLSVSTVTLSKKIAIYKAKILLVQYCTWRLDINLKTGNPFSQNVCKLSTRT